MRLPAGMLALTVEECRLLLERLTERVEDHLGVHRDEASWEHVAQADRLLFTLRRAAHEAGL